MYTDVTYQDWLATPDTDRPRLLKEIIKGYKASDDFQNGLAANLYFRSENPEVASKTVLKARAVEYKDKNDRTRKGTRMEDVVGNRVASSFLYRFVTQQNQYLLGNGVTLKDEGAKKSLGHGFDRHLSRLGERALLHGVSWGFWNADHLEAIDAVKDAYSGAVALMDERTSEPMALVQFWQVSTTRPLYVRLFTLDGVTEYRESSDGLAVITPLRPYVLRTQTDALGTVEVGGRNYATLPVKPFYGNEERRSELTPAIKSKIDLYDRILSDFGDNLDRSNDVFWVLNNFGGTMDEVAELLEQINRVKAVANMSDGTGAASTAEPHTIEVPYSARREALNILEKQLYGDYMALNMDELTGGSLTNVAIETATANLNLKADRFEWQAFEFVQKILALIGVDTEEIRFKRQTIANRSEIVNDIAVMRDYIDDETALKHNPYFDQDEIPAILARLAVKKANEYPLPDITTEIPEEPEEEKDA